MRLALFVSLGDVALKGGIFTYSTYVVLKPFRCAMLSCAKLGQT